MLVPVIAEVLAGLVILWFAVRLRPGRISRDSAVGVRTPSTMRSDAAFETANKAAAPLTGAGGEITRLRHVFDKLDIKSRVDPTRAVERHS